MGASYACQIMRIYINLDVILKKQNRDNDLRDIVLEQLFFWHKISTLFVVSPPRGSSRIINILESCFDKETDSGSKTVIFKKWWLKEVYPMYVFSQYKPQKESATKSWPIRLLRK